MRASRVWIFAMSAVLLVSRGGAWAAETAHFEAGFAKLDVTPREPLRMTGYGNRDHPSEGVDGMLNVRAMALRPSGTRESFILVQFDIIGVPADFTDDVARRLEDKYKVTRDHFVLCTTHTHAGPQLPTGLTNILGTPLTRDEHNRAAAYVEVAKGRIVEAVGKAIDDLKPATLSLGAGKVGFAANRRALKDGKWIGFGVNPDGPTDPTVDVLKIAAPDGKLRGVVFNYACHATTLTGDYYRINGDWPAYSAEQIEAENAGATALCTIGCGADANPEPRGTLEQSKAHGKTMASEVERVLAGNGLTPVTSPPKAAFGTADLAFELPTAADLKARLSDPMPQAARQAKEMLATLDKGGRLPASYPAPAQVWRFGDDLTMVFLGGEVVVDYAIRLKREIDAKHVWVTAYSNDVMGYIVSERVLREGGYEVTQSMTFYNRPGPWAAGTEEKFVSRIHEVVTQAGGKPPRK